MNHAAFDAAVRYLRDHWHLVTDDETAYKLAYHESLAPSIREAEAGRTPWTDVLRRGRAGASQLLGWRVGDQLQRMAAEHGEALNGGIAALIASKDGDALWDELVRSAGGEAKLEPYDKLRSAGARASLAAFVLFLHEPHDWPPFRPHNYGRPLRRILGARLDASTPGRYLRDYYAGVDRLRTALVDAGLPVRSNLDVQGALWIVNYKGVLDGRTAA